ncbi:MAG: hypothetical protein JWL87_240 [Candidatus Adlerbacteria bacterium]|nr:hypothetical protein [Candidatus Adlerbacteria bacterium]
MRLVQPIGIPVMSQTPPSQKVVRYYESQLERLTDTLLTGLTGAMAYSKLNQLKSLVLSAATNWPVARNKMLFVPVVPLAFFGQKTLRVMHPEAHMTMGFEDIHTRVEVGASPYWLVNLPEESMLRIWHLSLGCYKVTSHPREFTAAELVAIATHKIHLLGIAGMKAYASTCGASGHPWLRCHNGVPQLTANNEQVGGSVPF